MPGRKDTLKILSNFMSQGWSFGQTADHMEEIDHHRRKMRKAELKGNQSEHIIRRYLRLIPWVDMVTISPHNGPEDILGHDLTIDINRRAFESSLGEPLAIPQSKVYIQAKSSSCGVDNFKCRIADQHKLYDKDQIDVFLKEYQLVVLRADLEQRETLIQFLRGVLAMNIYWGRKLVSPSHAVFSG